MQPEHLVTFATTCALTWSFGSTLALICSGKEFTWRSFSYAAISIAVLGAVVWLNSITALGRNSVVYIGNRLLATDPEHLCAAAFGACVGFGPAVWPWQSEWSRPSYGLLATLRKSALLLSIVLSFLFVGVLAHQETLKPYLLNRGIGSIVANPLGNSVSSEFVVEEYHDCEFHPVQIAVGPDGGLYATGYRGSANQYGIVAKIAQDSTSGAITETQIARNLSRPHGLAFHEGNLYVSRSGQYARARAGILEGINTGAVTLLRDIDGDGVMDYYHDVLTDLPGAQGPDPLHQNNGIAFGPDGYLYTTIGSHSDRAPAVGEYEGTILRSRPDGSELEVFARGFRNPFDLAFGTDGELFSTDNDASDRRSGDELNHVVAGGHYGFPYADGANRHPEGAITPIVVETRTTLQGVAYTNSGRLPDAYRDCLYVVSYRNGEIRRMSLQKNGDTYHVNSEVFARIPDALDIAIDQNGTFYVSCFHSKKIYRVRYRGHYDTLARKVDQRLTSEAQL